MTLRRLLLSLSILVLACIGLAVTAIGPVTLRLMDRELLLGLPAGLAEAIRQPATVAERQAENGRLRYTEEWIPGADRDPPVRILVVEPKEAAPNRPGLLELHGGGFTHGSPEASLAMLVEDLALGLGITVVSVDYRLAPGTGYAGSLRDNYAALKWFHANAASMGVDPARIAILGHSAGGTHAAALSLHARDQGEVPVFYQALLSPALDDRTGSTVDPGETLGHFLWTRDLNKDAWTAFLGVQAGRADTPAKAVPMRAADVSRLPPTFISVGALDLFATESAVFAGKLRDAGVPVELHVLPGAFHGFQFIVPSAAVSRRAGLALEAFMTRQAAAATAGRAETKEDVR